MSELSSVINTKNQVNWERLLEEALTVEGSMSGIYNRFYNYSLGNQLLLHMQGVKEPVNTYKRWQAMGRQVLRGSKAKAIMIPLIYKATTEDGTETQRLRGFKLSNCLFTVSETTGEELPPAKPIDWSKERALGALAINEVPFEMLNGNVQGYSYDRNLTVSPVAAYPMKTWLHEASHIVSGHTEPRSMQEYLTHRGVYEFEAEGSAYILVNELGVTEDADLGESRSYIQGWLNGHEAPAESIRKVFRSTETILKAGRVAVAGEVAA